MSLPDLRYQAILFDFDGVLVDSEPIHFDCWGEILRPFGINLEWEYYATNCIGVSDRAMIATLAPLAEPPVEFDALYAQYPNKKSLFRERMLVNPPIPADTLRLLDDLRDFPLGLVTSSGQSEVAPILERLGIRDRFAAQVYGGDVARLKPAPDPYLRAAELLGVTRALVVEDSEAGIAAGTAAGFDVVRITTPTEVASKVRAALSLETANRS